MKRSVLFAQLATVLILSVFMMAFACRQDASTENAELQAEIVADEQASQELETTKQEIDEATAELDSLLNDIN